jgi:hypothetical protein
MYMKITKFGLPIILVFIACGTANARSIVYDEGQWTQDPGSTNNLPAVISTGIDGVLFNIGAGVLTDPTATTSGSYFITNSSGLPGEFPQPVLFARQFNWGTDANNPGNQNGITDQVYVDEFTPNSFAILFAYSASCKNTQSAGVFIEGVIYEQSNPCTGGEIDVKNGVVTATGWLNSGGGGTTVSAPEIDPNSASTGLSLLIGGLAVIVGRRKLPVVDAT